MKKANCTSLCILAIILFTPTFLSPLFSKPLTLENIKPKDAYFKIDIYPNIPEESTGSWFAISYYKDWGQAQCSAPGNDCHLYDWFTWWIKPVDKVTPPPNGWTTYYGQGEIPKYVWGMGKYMYPLKLNKSKK